MGDTPNRPAPSAAGTLAKTPLVHLLLYTLERGLTGTIELASPPPATVTAALVLISGQPAKVRTSEPAPYLGRVLLELGYLSEERYSRSLADLAKAKALGPALHGHLLLSQGAITKEQLDAGLREQVERKLRQVASMRPETAYAYFESFDGLHGWGANTSRGFDPIPMLWGMLRGNPPWVHVNAGLNRVAASPLRVARPAEVARLALGKEERAAVDLLGARPMTASELASVSGLPVQEAQLLAYLLLVTKSVEVMKAPRSAPPAISDAPRASSPSVSSNPVPPTSSPPRPSPAPATPSPAPATPSRVSPIPPPAPRVSSVPLSSPRTSPIPPLSDRLSPPPASFRPALSSASSARPSSADARFLKAGGTKPPTGSPSQRVRFGPPSSLSAELADRWHEIVDRAATIDRADYFMMLDLPRDAKREEIEAAFFALAKKWHPDRLPHELGEVRDACARVFGRMSEAHATLADDEKRTHYMRLLADGSGSPEMQETVAKVVEAATTFQKAEVCFKRTDYVQAEELCRNAVQADPTQPDYLALLAWLISLKPESQSPDKTKECIQMLDRAISMSDKCEKGFFWRGALYKRLGRGNLAFRDFRRAVDLNPRNIDAAREVRLHLMRGGTSSKPPAPLQKRSSPLPPKTDEAVKQSLFGRFFKKP